MRCITILTSLVAAVILIACPVQAADPPDNHGPQKPAPATGEQANPLPILRASKPVELSTDEIRAEMVTLFTKWGDAAAPYNYYLLSLPRPLTIKDSNLGRISDMNGKDFLYSPYSNSPITTTFRGPAIVLQIPPELQGLRDHNGMCVRLDGFGDLVPIPAAEYFCSHFHYGFVTRLVLGEYVRAWNKAGAKIDIDTLNFANGAKKIPIPAAFSQLASYQTQKPPAAPEETFDSGLGTLMSNNDLASAGILWGWKAASELDAIRDKQGDQESFKAAWKLVRNRFSPRQMGEISAYTMHFLLGFSRVANIRANTPAEALPQRDMSVVLGKLATDKDVESAKSLLVSFHEAFLAEFYAITINPRFKQEDKEKMLSAYFDFIRGWESGSLQAGEELFKKSFELGYTYGFRDGFKDGYSRGYAAGYRDGYATGFRDAWTQANKVIEQLKSELTITQAALRQAEADRDRFRRESEQGRHGGGILGFIQDVADVAGTVLPVIGSIIALF